MLRAGTDSFQALARRLRDFDLEVFFLGTATRWQSYTLREVVLPQGKAAACARQPAP
jgi:hypothetical protein